MLKFRRHKNIVFFINLLLKSIFEESGFFQQGSQFELQAKKNITLYD